MGDHSQFGGGSGASNMHPVVLVATVLAVLSVLVLRRKLGVAPVLIVIFLTPAGQQLFLGGFHFFVFRIIIIAGVLRVLQHKSGSRFSLLGARLTPIEKVFFPWAILHAVVFILLYRESSAAANQFGFLLDSCGGYIVFRYFIRSKEDILRAMKSMTVVAAVLALCMLYEHLRHFNPFSYINNWAIVPLVREGKVRSQGTFGNSITAGSFGATLLPLFCWLWKSEKARLSGAIGLLASTTIVMTSVASTPMSAYLGGILALFMWPIRRHMRAVRWGIVIVLASLALVMKAPVWFLLARIDFIGGHGWDRAALVDQFVRHFSEWWLLGTANNANWGADTWDACNQFVSEGLSGGIIGFVLFIVMVSRAFGMIGRARKKVEHKFRQEWFFWCLGAALFGHMVAFWGIDYFDQTRLWWFVFLAMISAATMSVQPLGMRAFLPFEAQAANELVHESDSARPVRASS